MKVMKTKNIWGTVKIFFFENLRHKMLALSAFQPIPALP
jgi:hypothetical protein